VRRPDGRDLDVILHVNPRLPEKGLAVVYNPLDQEERKVITLPLYYTGLTEAALIREQDGKPQRYTLWTAPTASKCRSKCRPTG
jgi:hypothetical protein